MRRDDRFLLRQTLFFPGVRGDEKENVPLQGGASSFAHSYDGDSIHPSTFVQSNTRVFGDDLTLFLDDKPTSMPQFLSRGRPGSAPIKRRRWRLTEYAEHIRCSYPMFTFFASLDYSRR